MPTVPRLGQQQVQASLGPEMKVSQSAPIEAFGGGKALSGLDSVVGLVEKIRNDADDMAVLEAETKLSKFENEFMYGDNGAYKKQGKDSFSLTEDFNKAYSAKKEEIYGSLSSERQRSKFGIKADQRKQSIEKDLMRHISVESQKYDDQTTNDYLKNEKEYLANNYQNPERIAESFSRQTSELMKYADRKGLSEESTKQLLINNYSKSHYSVISRMVDNGDDIGAEKYFNANKDYIIGDDFKRAKDELEVGIVQGRSIRFVDDIMRKGLTEDQAYAQAAKAFSGEDNKKLRDAIESRISRQFEVKRRSDRDQQEKMFEYAAGKIDQEGTLDNVPKSVITSLKPEYREKLKQYENKNPIRDDGTLVVKLDQMASNPATRQKFMEYDLLNEKGNLSSENFNRIYKIQKDLREGKGDAAKALNGAFSDDQIIKSVYESAGFKTKNTEDYAKYKLSVEDEIVKYKKSTGKQSLTNEEISNLSRNLVKETIYNKGFLYDSKKPRYLIEVDQVPDKDKEQITEFLTKQGKPVSDRNIIDLYLMKVNQK